MTNYVGRNPVRNCPRCGMRRQLGKNRDALCRSCYEVEPHWPEIKPPLNSEGIKP